MSLVQIQSFPCGEVAQWVEHMERLCASWLAEGILFGMHFLAVAQLEERRATNAEVTGSTPVSEARVSISIAPVVESADTPR